MKIINPSKKTDYSTKAWHDASGKFRSIQTLRCQLKQSFPDSLCDIPKEDIEFGYIYPGHGAKGQQIWITNNSDLGEMYATHAAKKRIMIWFFTQKKKRSRSPVSDCETSTNKRSCTKGEERSSKLAQVEEIVSELEQKHSGKYSREQLNVWAHMLQLKKHDSREVPPDKPFFRGSKLRHVSPQNSEIASTSVNYGVSPGKRIGLRTECLSQLDKWHQLFERGAISESVYKEMQETILEEMKTL